MPVFEAPSRWIDELNATTTTYGGWSVSMAVFGADAGAAPDIANVPLIGVSADRIVDDGTMAISVARAVGHCTYIVQDVKQVYIERADDGASASVLVRSEGGTITAVYLRAHVLTAV